MNFDPYSSSPPKTSPDSSDKLDPKLMNFVQKQAQTMQVYQMLEKVTEMCWDLCDITPKDKLDGRSETCLRNCSGRYQDTAEFMLNRFSKKVEQGGH